MKVSTNYIGMKVFGKCDHAIEKVSATRRLLSVGCGMIEKIIESPRICKLDNSSRLKQLGNIAVQHKMYVSCLRGRNKMLLGGVT